MSFLSKLFGRKKKESQATKSEHHNLPRGENLTEHQKALVGTWDSGDAILEFRKDGSFTQIMRESQPGIPDTMEGKFTVVDSSHNSPNQLNWSNTQLNLYFTATATTVFFTIRMDASKALFRLQPRGSLQEFTFHRKNR